MPLVGMVGLQSNPFLSQWWNEELCPNHMLPGVIFCLTQDQDFKKDRQPTQQKHGSDLIQTNMQI